MNDNKTAIDELAEAAIQAADTLNSLMPANPKSKKREWIWSVHNDLTKAISRRALESSQAVKDKRLVKSKSREKYNTTPTGT